MIVGAAVVAASLAAAYLLIFAPRAEADKMRAEVERFSERWNGVRECFFGSKSRSSDPRDAVILRELTDPQLSTEIAVCEESLREARREEGPTTGDAEVEERWSEMTDARRDLAKALAIRLQVPPPRPIPVLRRDLAAAAVKAEAAYAALRATAGLEPDPLDGEPVPDAALEVIDVGDAAANEVWVAGSRILAARHEQDKRWFAILEGDGSGEVTEVSGEDVLAFGSDWVARVVDGALIAEDLGAAAAGGASRRVEVARFASLGHVVGALEDGRSRLIVATLGDTFGLFRSDDQGATYKQLPLHGPTDGILLNFPLERRVVLDGEGVRFEIGGADLAMTLRPRYASYCFADRVSWYMTDRGLAAGEVGEPQLTPVTNSEEMPWLVNACTDTQALGVAPFSSDVDLPATRLRLCTRSDCRVSANLPRAYGADLTAAIGPLGGPMVAFAADGIALLWAGAEKGGGLAPRSWMRLPEASRLRAVVEWNGQVRAVVESKTGFALATFP